MEKQIKTIGVLTSGGDAPGMNAAVRAVVRTGLHKGFRMIGIQRGYNGLLNGECFEMNLRRVSNIISAGGTILYTARCLEFKTKEGQDKGAAKCRELGIDALVVTGVAGMSFLIFNLLCAPCFAAMGAIKREMNNTKWFWFAIGYECGFAYVIALIVNQLGNLFTGQLMTAGNGVVNIISLIVAFALIIAMIYLLVRPYKESNKLGVKVKA